MRRQHEQPGPARQELFNALKALHRHHRLKRIGRQPAQAAEINHVLAQIAERGASDGAALRGRFFAAESELEVVQRDPPAPREAQVRHVAEARAEPVGRTPRQARQNGGQRGKQAVGNRFSKALHGA